MGDGVESSSSTLKWQNLKQVYVLPERYSSKGEIPWKSGKSLWKGFCLPLQIFRPVPNLEPVSRNSRILSGDNISPFVSPMGPLSSFQIWQLFCLFIYLTHIKRAAFHGKRIIVSRISFRARKLRPPTRSNFPRLALLYLMTGSNQRPSVIGWINWTTPDEKIHVCRRHDRQKKIPKMLRWRGKLFQKTVKYSYLDFPLLRLSTTPVFF